jgi:acetolactate synthase I/II/III large subunit
VPSVADLLIAGIRGAGVRRLFAVGGPGPTEALRRSAQAAGLPVVLVGSEVAACVMAAVSGELGDAPGAAAADSAAAARSGLAHARLDRAPMIFLSAPLPALDPAGLGGAGAKQSLRVTADSVSHRIAYAARLSMAEPRGPVHLEVPGEVAERAAIPMIPTARPPAAPAPDRAIEAEAAALIEASSRPLIVAGLGCRAEDAGWLRALAEALPAPVLTTLKAKGAIPEPHPLALGVLGAGAPEEPTVHRADLVIAVGVDPAELGPTAWPFAAKVLYLGRAPHAGEGYAAAVAVVGEPGLVLEELAPRLRGRARADWDVAEIDRAKRAGAARLNAGGPGLTPGVVARAARELTPAGTLVAIDGSPAMLEVALAWPAVAPGECLVPNALATPGFALPAAIAAQLAHPARRVLCFTDAAGLVRVLGELETMVRLELPVVVVVMGGAGAPELVPIARGLGLTTGRAGHPSGVRQALADALAAGRPTLLDARPAA